MLKSTVLLSVSTFALPSPGAVERISLEPVSETDLLNLKAVSTT